MFDQKLDASIKLMNNPEKIIIERSSVSHTLVLINNILEGWGNQYSFCNNESSREMIDTDINDLLKGYFEFYEIKKHKIRNKNNFKDSVRRLIGVHLLKDSKRDPIIKT